MQEKNIIQLNFGGRYEILSDGVYSLNYAEKGICGSSMGKRMPDKMAADILSKYKEESRVKSIKVSVEKSSKEKSASLSAKPKGKKLPAAVKRQKKAKAGGVKLGGMLRKSQFV